MIRRAWTLLLLFACAACSAAEPSDHVLLIVIDTLRADHLGCMGYPRDTSPNLDRLAREGVLFRQAISQASFTSPSMVSLMSGRYVAKERLDIPADVPTLPEAFAAAGFATAGFTSNPLISEPNGFARGFQRFEAIEEHGDNRAIEAWWSSLAGRRSFTYVHITEPHDPYLSPEGRRRWRESKDLLPGDRAQFYREVSSRLGLSSAESDIARITEEIGGYDDEVRAADARVAELVALFERAGLRERGVIAITADHGEGLWEHVALFNGQRGQALRRGESPNLVNTLMPTHGNQVHHELVNVPLILNGGELLPRGEVIDAPVENVALFPTLLELAGARGPQGLHGKSLLRWLEKRDSPPVDFAFSFTRFNVTVVSHDGWALILPTAEGECGESVQLELFYLPDDPHQRRNVAADHPEVVARLRERAEQRLGIGIRESGAIGNDSLSALAQLGYTEQVELENERREMAALSTAELVASLNMSVPCPRRIRMAEELAQRTLDAEQRATLEKHLRFETSHAVIPALQRALQAASPQAPKPQVEPTQSK